MSLKVATWNINSLRTRLSHILTWLQDKQPDILALQETKLLDEQFPVTSFNEVGYVPFYSGQKAYNGVALLIKKEGELPSIRDIITDIPDFDDPPRRILGAVINDIYILNIYIPNGGEKPTTEKYQYKLRWLEAFNHFIQEEISKHTNMIILGDFNIAPEEIDVYDAKKWEGKVMFTEPERASFQNLLKIGFKDCFRLIHPEDQGIFSWWDYRRIGSFERNAGLRIDHILASSSFASTCKMCQIDYLPRSWARPSDHAPVLAEFRGSGLTP